MQLKDVKKKCDNYLKVKLQQIEKEYLANNTDRDRKNDAELLKKELLELYHPSEMQENIAEVFNIIRQNLALILKEDARKLVENELDKCGDNISNFFEKNDIEKLEETKFFEILGFSDETLQGIYNLAEHLYKKKQFQEANKILSFLYLIGCDSTEVVVALSLCLHELGEFKDAIELLEAAKAINQDEPSLYFYCALNYAQTNELEHATKELKVVENYVSSYPDSANYWLPNIAFVKRLIKKNSKIHQEG